MKMNNFRVAESAAKHQPTNVSDTSDGRDSGLLAAREQICWLAEFRWLIALYYELIVGGDLTHVNIRPPMMHGVYRMRWSRVRLYRVTSVIAHAVAITGEPSWLITGLARQPLSRRRLSDWLK